MTARLAKVLLIVCTSCHAALQQYAVQCIHSLSTWLFFWSLHSFVNIHLARRHVLMSAASMLCFLPLQDSVVVLYNWLKRETLSPHTWVTDYMNDLALPVNFVGLSTEDRRFIYPQKEVGQKNSSPIFHCTIPTLHCNISALHVLASSQCMTMLGLLASSEPGYAEICSSSSAWGSVNSSAPQHMCLDHYHTILFVQGTA